MSTSYCVPYSSGKPARRLTNTLAKKLLNNTKIKVHEIAEHMGYENAHYFSYSFKKYAGETPQQYRNKQQHG